MGSFILRRAGSAAFVLLGVTVIVFLLVQLVPGDPARAILGSTATAEALAQVRSELGLDKPLLLQYADYLGGLLTGDLGTSINLGQPVSEIILPRLANTVVLAAAALLISVVLGVVVGVLAARRPHGLFDRAAMLMSVAGASLPVYWAALVAIAAFSLQLKLVPTGGMYNARAPGGLGDLLLHLALPATIAALVPLAIIARQTRGALIEALSQDYVKVLRASGIPEAKILWKHALRNALPPVIGIVGLQVGYLLGGVIFVEVVFQWPGLGQQLYTSITANDLPVIQAGVLFIAAVFVLVNLLTDVIVSIVDPRGKVRAS